MNRNIQILKYLMLSAFLLFQSNIAISKDDKTSITNVKVAVLAYHGKQRTISRWQPTIDYLNSQFKLFTFQLITLELHQVKQTIRGNKIDFIITNTGNYIELEHQFGISRMTTLINNQLNRTTTLFGAVIFTRSDRDDINSIEDIKNKSLIAVDKAAFGGFQMAWAELKKFNIDPFKDLTEIAFTGYPQVKVVQGVLDRKYDVGTFRTDSLEQLEKMGAIDLSKIKILNQKQIGNFPFIHSTDLYPEWPFSKLQNTSNKLAHRVAVALLSIETNSNAARAANNAGWTIPLNYKPANDMMKDLHIGPYKYLDNVSLNTILSNYWQIVALVVLLFLVILISAISFKQLNKKLKHTNHTLEDSLIEITELTVELKHLATHDPLTNIYNRYAFNNFLDKELQRCDRNNSQLAVIIIDLDNFKLINDSYGHHIGDEYLKQFCTRINSVLRDSDINARFGGDEFAILCLDITDINNIQLLTNRILKVAETDYNLMDLETPLKDTRFSLGVAVYPENGSNAQLLLRHADLEMYKMKKVQSIKYNFSS